MADKLNDGGHAFPTMTDGGFALSGMSLRDWFAGQAMAGLLSQASPELLPVWTKPDAVASAAFLVADAMLKARGQS